MTRPRVHAAGGEIVTNGEGRACDYCDRPITGKAREVWIRTSAAYARHVYHLGCRDRVRVQEPRP